VDGLLQSPGRCTAVVRARPRDRRDTDMGALQGAPKFALRAAAPIGPPLRALVVPSHGDRGGLPGSVSSSAAARQSSR